VKDVYLATWQNNIDTICTGPVTKRCFSRAFQRPQIIVVGDHDVVRSIRRNTTLLSLSSSSSFEQAVSWYNFNGHGRYYFSTTPGGFKNNDTVDSSSSSIKVGTSSSSGNSSDTDKLSIAKSSVTPAIEKKEVSMVKKATDAIQLNITWALKSLLSMLAKTPGVLWYYMTHPTEFKNKLVELKDAAVHEAHHYYMGSKLLAADVRTAKALLGRTLRGSTLSRRERKQLLRTTTDLFRLVPMSVFVLVPFMEFALPFALKLFPNMLPSTFQDTLKEEEKMKGELQMRLSMAGFFQDTLTELAKEQKKFAQIRKRYDSDDATDSDSVQAECEKEASASSFLEFLKKARTGEAIPPDVIIKFSKYFEDNLTLDNMGRMQLINMCKYMGIAPYGNDNLLRFQLRHRINTLKADDQRILWDGIDSLTKMELREACRERGMRSIGLSKIAYRNSLQQWLDLSVQKNVPISLLIMSRTFFLHDELVTGESSSIDTKGVIGLADAMSGIDKEVLNEIVLEMASTKEKSNNADVMKIQLEVLEHQNEMIKEEQEERDAIAAKEKAEVSAKEKAEAMTKEVLETAKIDEMAAALENPLMENEKLASRVADTVDLTDAASATAASLRTVDTEQPKEDEHAHLSMEEIDAISQLTSSDPVLREREELQRIKDKMQSEQSKVDVVAQPIFTDKTAVEEAITSASQDIRDAAEKEAMEISMVGDAKGKLVVESQVEEPIGDKKLQKAIDRLQARVQSMVGKIETQLSDVEVKIGDKFHLLDKDGDGVLTMEEMAQVLQTVLKRELTAEEAMAIAEDMDTNKDGVFSIAELAQWAETNTIVKLAEDGREKDLNEMISKRVADLNAKLKMAVKEELKVKSDQ